MANPERGQVAMEAGGLTYTMQLSPHALALLKKQTGLGLQGVIKSFQENSEDPDFELVGAIVWATTQDHHPDLTVDAASSLFPAGGLEEIMAKIQEVFAAAFPKQSAKVASTGNPQKAAKKET